MMWQETVSQSSLSYTYFNLNLLFTSLLISKVPLVSFHQILFCDPELFLQIGEDVHLPAGPHGMPGFFFANLGRHHPLPDAPWPPAPGSLVTVVAVGEEVVHNSFVVLKCVVTTTKVVGPRRNGDSSTGALSLVLRLDWAAPACCHWAQDEEQLEALHAWQGNCQYWTGTGSGWPCPYTWTWSSGEQPGEQRREQQREDRGQPGAWQKWGLPVRCRWSWPREGWVLAEHSIHTVLGVLASSCRKAVRWGESWWVLVRLGSLMLGTESFNSKPLSSLLHWVMVGLVEGLAYPTHPVLSGSHRNCQLGSSPDQHYQSSTLLSCTHPWKLSFTRSSTVLSSISTRLAPFCTLSSSSSSSVLFSISSLSLAAPLLWARGRVGSADNLFFLIFPCWCWGDPGDRCTQPAGTGWHGLCGSGSGHLATMRTLLKYVVCFRYLWTRYIGLPWCILMLLE